MQYLFYFFLIILALIVVFLIAWILLALLIRAFSLLIFYWVIGFSVMFAGGLIFGLVIPWRVLRNRGLFALRQLTPEDVVTGKAFKGRPRGESKHYGWDRAWPIYIPFQARQDAKGVVGEARILLGKFWEWITNRIRFTRRGDGGLLGMTRDAAGLGPMLFWISILPIPFFGFWAGVWLSIGAWLLAMLALGFLVWIFQGIMLLGLRSADIIRRRRSNASLKCYYCYGESRTPSYRCLNPQCTIIHRSMLPGPLGLATRRCACGTQLPNTIRAAARTLPTLCPYCNRELADSSGIRHTVQLPVIGSVGAGKTRLLMAAIVQLELWLTERQGTINAVTPEAETYREAARLTVHSHAETVKTPDALPEGVPLILRDAAGEVTELQLMDAAGEAFATWDTTADLRYLDNANAFLFVLDALAWPQLLRELTLRGLAATVVVTGENQKDSYAAAIDRMRAESVPLRLRKLGVVVSKADILLKLPSAAELANSPIDSVSIRRWMLEHDFDRLITRMEMDFGEVRYFLVDSMDSQDPDQALSPWWTLQWALQANGSTLTFVDPEPKAGPRRAAAPPVPAIQVVGEAGTVVLDAREERPEERVVSVWLVDSDGSIMVGARYHMGVRIRSARPYALASPALPNLRDTEPLDIIVAPRGHDVEIRPAWQTTTLPLTGDTEDLVFEIEPVVEGPVSVTVSVHLARSLARIDELDVALVAATMQETKT